MMNKYLLMFFLFISITSASKAQIIYNTYSAAVFGVAYGLFMDQTREINRDVIPAVRNAVRAEQDVRDKTTTTALAASTTTMVTMGAVVLTVNYVESELNSILTMAYRIQRGTMFFRHGIDRIVRDLEREQKYMEKIQTDMIFLSAGIQFGGGIGHAYTAAQKIMLRLVPIRKNITKLRKEVNNKTTIFYSLFPGRPI